PQWLPSPSLPLLPPTTRRRRTGSWPASSLRAGWLRSVTTAVVAHEGGSRPGFEVHLDNFDGPFDLLLSLISKHEMEITEVALARVTDDFLQAISAQHDLWDLSQAS